MAQRARDRPSYKDWLCVAGTVCLCPCVLPILCAVHRSSKRRTRRRRTCVLPKVPPSQVLPLPRLVPDGRRTRVLLMPTDEDRKQLLFGIEHDLQHDAQVDEQLSSSIFSLPAELRLMIFDRLFDDTLIFTTTARVYHFPSPSPDSSTGQLCNIFWPLPDPTGKVDMWPYRRALMQSTQLVDIWDGTAMPVDVPDNTTFSAFAVSKRMRIEAMHALFRTATFMADSVSHMQTIQDKLTLGCFPMVTKFCFTYDSCFHPFQTTLWSLTDLSTWTVLKLSLSVPWPASTYDLTTSLERHRELWWKRQENYWVTGLTDLLKSNPKSNARIIVSFLNVAQEMITAPISDPRLTIRGCQISEKSEPTENSV